MDKIIIEGNKLIAEFMGAEIEEKTFGEGHPCVRFKEPMPFPFLDHDDDCTFISYEFYYDAVSVLQFNTSWDWLHPVLEKITTLNPNEGKLRFWYNLSYCHCHIWANGVFGIEWECRENSGSSINAAFSVVVKFITWYNSQSKNTNNG